MIVRKDSRYPYDLKARLANKLPALAVGEVPIKVDVSVPDALFKRPQLQASITVPESSVSSPVIDAVVLDNIQQVLQQQTGMDVKVSLVKSH